MATQSYTNGVTLTDSTEFNNFDSVAYSVLTGVGGTANAITATGPASYTYSASRPPIWFVPANTNTGATTINVTQSGASALGAKNVFFNGVACVGGELRANVPAALIYDGTQFQIIANGVSARGVLGTAVASTSGTSITFTGIPAFAREFTVHFVGVSTNGTQNWQIQIGPSGGVETSGYLGGCSANGTPARGTSGYLINNFGGAGVVLHGQIRITLEDASDNTWTSMGILSRSDADGVVLSSGTKSCAGVVDRLRIIMDGVDTFDAGEINVTYRG